MAHTKKKTQWIIFLWLSSQSFPKNFPSSSKVELESLVDWHWQPTNGQKNLVQKIIVKCCNDNNKRGTNNNGLMIAKKKSLFNFTFFFQSSGFFGSTNYGHFVTFLHIIQHDFHCVFQSHNAWKSAKMSHLNFQAKMRLLESFSNTVY